MCEPLVASILMGRIKYTQASTCQSSKLTSFLAIFTSLVFFCHCAVSSPLPLFAAAVAPGLRPFAFLPRPCPLLGSDRTEGGSPPPSSLALTSSGRIGSTWSTGTVFLLSRQLSIFPAINTANKGHSWLFSFARRCCEWGETT